MTGDPVPDGTARRSPGGHVVHRALVESGLVLEPQVSLFETARPRRRPFRAILCQNAWNFVPEAEFRTLLEDYPLRSRLLYRARRGVARYNVGRAHRVVVLSDFMATLVRSTSRNGVQIAHADLTPSLLNATPTRPPWIEEDCRFVVVPGTITWYKRPDLALTLVGRAAEVRVIFAGADDGSGCLQALRRESAIIGVDSRVELTSPAEMLWLLRHAEATFVLGTLESLSLSLAEALAFSRHVVASDIPVHREVAARLGREPLWLSSALPDTHTIEPAPAGERLTRLLTERGSLWGGVVEALSR